MTKETKKVDLSLAKAMADDLASASVEVAKKFAEFHERLASIEKSFGAFCPEVVEDATKSDHGTLSNDERSAFEEWLGRIASRPYVQDDPTTSFGGRFARLVSALGKEAVANAAGVSSKTIDRWAREESFPDATELAAISKLSGLSLDWLVLGKSEQGEGAERRTLNGIDRVIEAIVRAADYEKNIATKIGLLKAALLAETERSCQIADERLQHGASL